MAVVEQENPLVEGLERLPVHPTTLVIFGATGDLAHRKLLPAIYNLAHEGALPERFNLIAVSRIGHGERRVPRAGARVDREVLAPAARRAGAGQAARAGALRARHLRRRLRLREPGRGARQVRPGGGPSVQPHLLPLDVARLLRADRREARRARAPPARRRRRPRRDREAVRHAPGRGPGAEPPGALGAATSRRSTASTTTSGRRRSRTCWRSASRTGCSSRSGTATTSTTCRSPRRRTSASGRRAGYYDCPARCATWSRTTCSSCSTLLCMEPPVTFDADEVRDEKVKVLHAVAPPPDA